MKSRVCKKNRWWMAALLMAATAQSLPGQAEMRRALVDKGPAFYVDAISYISDKPDRSRIDLYAQVPHQELKFVKEGTQYLARYELTARLLDDQEQLITERSWREEIRLADFGQTLAPALSRLSQRSFDVLPGSYRLTVQFRDDESGREGRQSRMMLVPDFRKDSVSISDIMIVSRLTTDGARRTIVPNIAGTLTDPVQPFYAFFEIYRKSPRDSVILRWRLFDAERKEVLSQNRVEATPESTTQAFVPFTDLALRPGIYFLSVEAWKTAGDAETEAVPLAIASRTFSVRSSDLPPTITDLDRAIEQLRYVARSSEMEYIREPQDPAERKARFLEFWQKRDPEPQTPRNELMEEYYDRIEYANKNFGHYLEGWRTDMGMVFIRFGQPENIERHPFEYNSKPYEIWYYYQLNRQFIFVDESGFGDYRLRYPTTDLWGRIR